MTRAGAKKLIRELQSVLDTDAARARAFLARTGRLPEDGESYDPADMRAADFEKAMQRPPVGGIC